MQGLNMMIHNDIVNDYKNSKIKKSVIKYFFKHNVLVVGITVKSFKNGHYHKTRGRIKKIVYTKRPATDIPYILD